MSIRILTGILFILIMTTLVIQRFSLPLELPVRVIAGSGEDPGYGFGEGLRRGSIVETQNGFLELEIGQELAYADQSQTHIWLAQNTSIQLDRLYKNELVIRLIKGRILAKTDDQHPITIKTNFTQHVLSQGLASFINYDFLETIHLIPLKSTSITTSLRETNETFDSSAPISIHETPPVSHEPLETNLSAGDSKEFYDWTDILTY